MFALFYAHLKGSAPTEVMAPLSKRASAQQRIGSARVGARQGVLVYVHTECWVVLGVGCHAAMGMRWQPSA